MKTVRNALLLTLVWVSPVPGIDAAYQQKDLERLWAKSAVLFFERPKLACVCFDGTVNQYRLGHVIRAGLGLNHAGCFFSTFNPDGTLQDLSEGCGAPWEPLPR